MIVAALEQIFRATMLALLCVCVCVRMRLSFNLLNV